MRFENRDRIDISFKTLVILLIIVMVVIVFLTLLQVSSLNNKEYTFGVFWSSDANLKASFNQVTANHCEIVSARRVLVGEYDEAGYEFITKCNCDYYICPTK